MYMAATFRLDSSSNSSGADSSVGMSLSSEAGNRNTGTNMRRPANKHALKQRTFQFIPKDLAAKCRKLIESYHAMYGYVGLPDMLWLSDARDVIECHEELTKLFKKASKSRTAKRANESFLSIATTIVSLEVLARDFASWGKRFPAAKREAEKVLGDHAVPATHMARWIFICFRRSASAGNLRTH